MLYIYYYFIHYYLCIMYFWMFEGPKEDGQMLIGFTLFKERFYYYYYYWHGGLKHYIPAVRQR